MSELRLQRKLSFIGLISTGICSMLGASIYIVPFMIHRNVPGIGPYVLPAFMMAAIPAIFAALAYAMLSSAMPRAGGSYIYASRGLNPYLGFIASFAQWFGLSIAIGVISYVIVPFIRDVFSAMDLYAVATWLELGWVRVGLALLLLWTFIFVNLRGLNFYEYILVPMMFIMFALGGIVIYIGLSHGPIEYRNMLGDHPSLGMRTDFDWMTLLSASALLISSFIGFDSIAQAGGEVADPSKKLPRAIIWCILIVAIFYFLFTAAVYHVVPWQYMASQAALQDITAPGLLSPVISKSVVILVLTGAAIALINDLPAMLLSVSRLSYAWSKDEVFPKVFKKIDSRTHIPSNALLLSGGMASVGILGSHFAGDFFLGVDIMVTSMIVNFILMCITVITLSKRNQTIANQISVFKSKWTQLFISVVGILLLSIYLFMHIRKDLHAEVDAWYFRSTPIWIIVMGVASIVYFWHIRELKKRDPNFSERFNKLP